MCEISMFVGAYIKKDFGNRKILNKIF